MRTTGPAVALTPRMRELLVQAGSDKVLGSFNGGQELRTLYQNQTCEFNYAFLDGFSIACFLGDLDGVVQAFLTGIAPPLDGSVTDFKLGYASLVIFGCHHVNQELRPPMKHAETLEFLLKRGCPPDVPDICRYTALSHATRVPGKSAATLCRILLRFGANVDEKDIYGVVPVMCGAMCGNTGAVDVLMEAGARLDLPDADGFTPESLFVTCGPQITAIVRKWQRRRAGEQAPLEESACARCGKSSDGEKKLKQCSACHSVRYCSTECQRAHWKSHKPNCKTFNPANTVVLKPHYTDLPFAMLMPSAPMVRQQFYDSKEKVPEAHTRFSQAPTSYPKSVIIKIQVPYAPGQMDRLATGDMLVYTKKRDLVCLLRRCDAPESYDHVARVIHEKGPGHSKGYFAAELKSKTELVVKVNEILAEQPF